MPPPFVPAAEAAYIGGVTTVQVNRLVDEAVVPPALVRQVDGARRVARLLAAYARFFFATDAVLHAAARKQVLTDVTTRLERSEAKDYLLGLECLDDDVDWAVSIRGVIIDISSFVAEAATRAKDVDHADQLVSLDVDIMGGAPCFVDTRVPIDIVLASIDSGQPADRVQGAYPFLTSAHIEAARIYNAVHPRRGRPRRLQEANPDLKPIQSGTVMLRPRKA